ncbi:hypothetical protein GLYMA_04G153100v4 [Glycine max]|nr:hypothetical protein GLYMA_04G153100v4 [Glycine max]KAH1111480.1 hypothetical protein GYH30_010036 [Glycine max]
MLNLMLLIKLNTMVLCLQATTTIKPIQVEV